MTGRAPFPLIPFAPRAGRVVERNLTLYRRIWLVLASGLAEPVLYLFAIGFGLGTLVHSVALDGGRQVSYAQFVAPGLMATAAMNGAIYDSTFNLFFKLKMKVYDAVLATPMAPADVAVGEVIWALIRGTIYALSFVVVMFIMGLTRSPLALLAVPGSMLIGFTFASLGSAATTYLRKWQDFDLIQLVLLPMFLFSGTFFPASAYPGPVALVIEATPLYHGVHLLRNLTTGILEPGMIWDAVYLVSLGLVGVAITSRRLGGLLLK